MIVADLDRMDRLAATGRSPLHRASPAARVAAAVAVAVAAVLAEDPVRLAAMAAVLLGLGAWAGVEPHRLALRSLAPLPFLGALFLLHADAPPSRMALLLLRAAVSAMSMALLLSTTPFADVLRVLSPVLPRSLSAALAVLHRSVFLLVRSSGHLAEAARLRGVRGGVGVMVGGLLLQSFERMENVACVLHVRGIDAPDPDVADAFRLRPWDLLPAATAAAALALSLAGGAR